MKLKFVKMHGAGNDFVFIDDLSESIELSEEQVRFLCDRHFGVGADGVILVRPSKREGCAAYMHYVNDDGSVAEMCGNGVRCFAKYLVDNGIVAASAGQLVADTRAGSRAIRFETDEGGRLTHATVDMGEPAFEPRRIPTTLAANGAVTRPVADGGTAARPVADGGTEDLIEPAVIEATIEAAIEPPDAPSGGEVGEGSFFPIPPALIPIFTDGMRFTCVNMGNPHAVAFLEGEGATVHGWKWGDLGSALECHPVFPERCNIEFARVVDSGRIEMRVWERGVGETLACGTGACAVLVAAAVTGRAGRSAVVSLLGGDLRIEWLENNHVMMTGPATTVYEGTIEL